jgi:hypothetical protein
LLVRVLVGAPPQRCQCRQQPQHVEIEAIATLEAAAPQAIRLLLIPKREAVDWWHLMTDEVIWRQSGGDPKAEFPNTCCAKRPKSVNP